jgi:hypothetical protein
MKMMNNGACIRNLVNIQTFTWGNLGETTTFPLIVYFVHGHGTIIQMSFGLVIPKGESRNS